MENLRILVVGGHPADVFDHCGGTLAHHTRRGDKVTALALTQGLRIHDVVISEKFRFQKEEISPEELENIIKEREQVKYDEVRRACALFGITDVRFLSYDDKVLQLTTEMIVAVAKVIRDVKPHIVITHYPLENGTIGSHHGNTGKIVMDAISLAGTVDYDDPNTPWRVPQVFFMNPLEATIKSSVLASEPSAYCNYYVDITDVVDLKVKALDIMVSQQYEGAYARKHTECWDGKNGHFMGIAYAEAFITCYPEIGDFLQVSKERLERANEPEKATRERGSVMIAPFVK